MRFPKRRSTHCLCSAALASLFIVGAAHAHTGMTAEDLNSERSADLDAISRYLEAASPREKAEMYIQTAFDTGLLEHDRNAAKPATAIPAGTKLASVLFPRTDVRKEIRINLELPMKFVYGPDFTEERITRIATELFGPILNESAFDTFMLYVRDPKTGRFMDVQELLPKAAPPKVSKERDLASDAMAAEKKPAAVDGGISAKNLPVIAPGNVTGALSGKTIYINASHGWFDDDLTVGRWRVQRGNCYGIIEDFSSPEFINMYVLPMLRNAGAKVQTVRESDLQTNMVIVDNSDGTSNPSNGTYVETGTWSTSSLNGFVQKTGASWNGVTINPFSQGSGQNRLAGTTTGGTPTATATWTAVIPADGYYNVYASWTGYSARANDARYMVHHSGGVTEVRMNQKIDGYTWNLLGNFYFEAGAPESERQVVLTNISADGTASNVSADAVRWGGGMGDMARHSSGVSGRPRWEEEAVNYLQWDGFGYSGLAYTGTDDEEGGWADRTQYAQWEHSIKDGSVEDAIYFAFHTNAAGSTCGTTARGLSTYRHSTATTASTNLQNIMHDTMYDHIESLWFPGWTVRGKNVTNFGENSQTNLGTGLPGFLIEGLFHDNQADTTGYADPRFRNDYARAIVQGVINYFEDRDGITLTNPPETPRNLRAISTGGGNVQITWDAPLNSSNDVHFGGAATSYIVYRSSNGFGFDNGTTVASGTTLTVSGVPADAPTCFRVAAVNAGGISFPTETLAASDGDIKALIVNGFDRNERSLVPTQTITNAGTDLRRLDPRRFQAFNYSVEHANSLAPLGIQISGSSNEAVASGAVNLGDYDLVFWILGEESTTDETLSTAEQTAVANYLALGDRGFFISGAEIGWDLDSQGTTGDRTFFNGTLRADYVGDDAGTYAIASTATGPFAGISSFNFDVASGARYDAEFPDRLTTSSGSTVALTYSGGTADTAAVAYDGASRVLVFGFPFETIASAAKRDEVMAAAVTFLLPDAPSAPSALSATTNSQTQIDLSWTDNSSNETGFIIARSTTSGGPYTDIYTTSANATSYSNTGLTANTTYYYVVRATASVGDSSNSAQASATTLPNAPAAPSGLSATAASQTQINLSWTDNSSNETGFIIARSTTSGGPYTDIYTTSANATSYSNTGLTANTTYYYVVRATNTGGSSANSAQASATTPPNIPSAPSGLSATAASSSQINLSWTDNSSNETGFIIARSNVSGGPYTDIYTTAANATSYSNTSLNASTPYYYVVRATNASGSSANSSQASTTTLQADRISGGSFEGTFVGGVGPGWTSWTASGSAAIGFGRATINKQDGAASQYWNRADTSAVDGGVYQTINVIPGGTYQITGWMKRQSTFTGSFIRVGYDLTGGTNGTAASVTYTDITGTNNTWNQYSQSVVATGNTMTIFARGGHTSTSGGTNAYYYFDAVTVIGPGANLSANGSMEGTYVSGVAPSWTSFTTSGTPTFGRASVNYHDGAYSQYWNRSDTAAFDGGVRQTITTVPGQAYTISGWMKRQSTLAGTTMRMGYDLTGGTNPSAGTVVYTDITGGTNNVWVQYTANVVATGTSITVFARGGHTGTTGGSTAYFYVDEIKVYVP